MDNKKWIYKAFYLTFIITLLISGISNTIANNSNIIILLVVTITIIILGILFDMVGTSVLTANEATFHAKASNKIKGAKEAIKLIKNSSTISSFFNDVIGDICGVVSGSMGAMIAIYLSTKIKIDPTISALIVSALISSLTVGGKSIGKKYAVEKSDEIIFIVAKIISKFKRN